MVSFLTSPHPKLQQLPSRFIKTDCRIIANLLWSVETSPPEQTISFNHKPLPNPSSSDWPCILLRFWEPDSGRGITQEPINLLMCFQTRTVAAFARRTCTTQLPGAKAVIISRTRRSCFFETHLRHGFFTLWLLAFQHVPAANRIRHFPRPWVPGIRPPNGFWNRTNLSKKLDDPA